MSAGAVRLILVGAAALSSVPVLRAAKGEEVFAANCASCHGADGKGRTPAGRKFGAKDLTKSRIADAEMEKQIVTGTSDAKGNARMPSFKTKLAPDQISAVIEFVKTLRQ